MSFIEISKKVTDGQRLTVADAMYLFDYPDLMAIGSLANQVNFAKNADRVFYNVNRHINPTNICVLSCKFCAYSRKPGDPGAYAYSIEEMLKKAGEASDQGATELHMVGGLHPRWRFSYYVEMLRAIKTAYPHMHLKAFTVVELDWMAKKERRPIMDLLQELREAGLGSLPGGGAEIFHPEIREKICDTKVPAELWLNTHKEAHSLGMHSNATMLYGHIESYIHRVDHMERLRNLQDETGGFNAFIPLSFQPFQNEMGIDRYTFGYDDLKTVAIARLFLDNFNHIKSYWIMSGQDIAQLATHFGANDIDGTVVEEKISRMAGGRSGMQLSRNGIEDMIYRADKYPVERDTLYNPVRDLDTTPELKVAFPKAATGEEFCEELKYDAERLASLMEKSTLHSVLAGTKSATVPSQVGVDFHVESELPGGDSSFAGIFAALEAEQAKCKTPTGISVDLAAWVEKSSLTAGNLLEFLWALGNRFTGTKKLRGLKALWSVALESDVSVGELLKEIKKSGIDYIESSPLEVETDLTHGEVGEIHRQIHGVELKSVGKVEIVAGQSGANGVLWEQFIRRIHELLALGTPGLWGLQITPSPRCYITPVDYMKAIAVAGWLAGDKTRVIAPMDQMPTLSQKAGEGTRRNQQVTEKTGPMMTLVGARHLGSLNVNQFDIRSVCEDVRSIGASPYLSSPVHKDPIVPGIEVGNVAHTPTLIER